MCAKSWQLDTKHAQCSSCGSRGLVHLLKRLNFIKTVKCKLCPAVHFAAEVLIVIIIISERSALSINERNTCVQVTD